VDEHIGLATAGLLADGKHIASRLRDEAFNFRDNYNSPVTVQVSEGRRPTCSHLPS
jgi:20S proteasome subunit alpha 7